MRGEEELASCAFLRIDRSPRSGRLMCTVLREDQVTKKAAEPLFLLPNKVPANAVRPLILNLKVQGGHLPDASGASV
jgi:hypothetical protein